MTKPSKMTVLAWTQLVRAHNTARCEIDRALKEAGLPVLEWYDVLLELERAGQGGLRPFKLQQCLLLPQYAISRLLDRLEGAGLIDCRSCNEDGRGQVAVISQAGTDMRVRMWPVYAAAIQRSIGEQVSGAQAKRIGDLLGKIASP